jgi:DNA-binding NarL/FixJ family response regulator
MITAASYGRVCHAPAFVQETPFRILIAEDDEKLAALVEHLLDGDGRFTVIGHAATGDEAVRLVERERPDLVLMDIGMPGLNGIDATRVIHERDAAQHVVIYTGSEEYEDVGRADAAGAAGYLHKEALLSPELADALHVLHTNYLRNAPDPGSEL